MRSSAFLPDPKVVNGAAVVDLRYQGRLSAIVAPLGLLGGPMRRVLLRTLLYDHYGALPLTPGGLRGIAARWIASGAGRLCGVTILGTKPYATLIQTHPSLVGYRVTGTHGSEGRGGDIIPLPDPLRRVSIRMDFRPLRTADPDGGGGNTERISEPR